jgi:hypothetical protein
MIDISLVKERYARMTDEQLIQLAQTERHDLTAEALSLLKDEFSKRGLDLDAFNYTETKQTHEEFDEPIPGFQNYSAGAGDVVKELNHLKNEEEKIQLTREDALLEGEEEAIAVATEEEVEKLIKKCNRRMWIDGIIFLAGTVATMLGLEMAKEGKGGDSYIVFWGAIAFGGMGFLVAYFNKKKYKAVLFNIRMKKENKGI